MVPIHLRQRVEDFLSGLRLGVDFGETTGGLGLLHGRTVLHAESFVDFHSTTLETKRTLRRGRRTRHSKKMRLARLRSWVLRQKLPDGTRLPDPYPIMRDRRFQTKPGLFEQKGEPPTAYPTWIAAAMAGAVDSSGFVCALTHLFQKRGYKYDDKELAEFSEARLLDFLDSCCLLEQAPELAAKMEAEVQRRGKPKMIEAYRAALTRPSEPRKAVPRQIKEGDLRAMVAAFGKRVGLPDETTQRWQKELCGLLNRVLREARFENRLKSTCAWCEKKTARLKKPGVREKAYLAAVGNVRVCTEVRGKTRPLNEQEKAGFIEWWRRRQLPRDEQQKIFVPRAPNIFDRAPAEANIEKAFAQLGVVKSWLRDAKGKPYLGYGMLSQVNNLLNHEPRGGRASLCMEHLEMAAAGKHMKDAGVEWQTMKIRRAPNPCLEQHDARVMQRIERLLFLKNRRGEAAWRWQDEEGKPLRLSFITLEVPRPETLQVGKGQQTQRQGKGLREQLFDETGGVCIYQHTATCLARHGALTLETMEKEHIVPKERGGPDVRVNLVACCHDCNHPDSGKGGRLPSEWMGYGSAEWQEFEVRVNQMNRLPDAKKNLLLLPPGQSFPEDPTPLAHVGARPRAFVAELIRMFERYQMPPPTVEYRLDAPHVQRVDGKWTTDLRQAWLWKDEQAREPNFPVKDRADLFNHAQDAVLLAATPPHTWRSQVLVDSAIRLCVKRDGQGQLVFENGRPVKELRRRPGLPLLDIAPDWVGFMQRRRKPIVTVLGRMKASWKRQMMDQSFYRKPDGMGDKFLTIHKPLQGGISPGRRPGQRRHMVEVPKGGLLIQVPYFDPASAQKRNRKVQVKPVASTAAIFWRDAKGRFQISLERPAPIRRFVLQPVEPPLPEAVKPIGRWERGQTIRLQARGDFPAGFYRVKELAEGGIIVIAENNLTAAIAERLQLPKEVVKTTERKVGKRELCKLFPQH